MRIYTCSRYFRTEDGAELRVETYQGPTVTITFDGEGKVKRIRVGWLRRLREVGIDWRTYLGVYRVGKGPGPARPAEPGAPP
ncbi:MAG TPA: hypothetical protein VKE69_04185 [Planctomycetota bacterium]|nr:hypothetical protein [Planctomycetota bacterium]